MGVSYITELFIAWYSGSEYEFFTFFKNRVTGEYAFEFWAMFIFNAILPQLFWSKKVRQRIWIVFIISILINVGMWYERYVIVVTSLSKEFLPASWAPYHPTMVEVGFYVGTIGMFSAFVLLFFRFIPQLAIHEIKMISKYNEQQTTHLKPGHHHDYE
jgi:molybdopterin-containing oxidoreductase family membrane subunit